MKLFLITLISAFSLLGMKANATDDVNVSAAVAAAFQSSFKGAADVAWKVTDNFSKAEFTLNGQHVAAFYDANANLMAVTRNISSTQLPILLQKKLRTTYSECWISDLFELSDESGTIYYATVEDGEQKITLKSSGNNEWNVFQKQRKS